MTTTNAANTATQSAFTHSLLKTSPTSLKFTSYTSSPVGSQTVTLTNVSRLPVELTSIATDPSNIFQHASNVPTTLLPGQSVAIQVQFIPPGLGRYAGTLQIFSRLNPGLPLREFQSLRYMQNVISIQGESVSGIRQGSLSVVPFSAAVAAGGTVQFAARVDNIADPKVSWLVCGTLGGNSTCGTISGTGLYRAPNSASGNQTVIVTAVSGKGATQTGTAAVTILGSRQQPVSVLVAPSSAAVASGQSISFSAAVNGAANTGVTWSAKFGSVSASGVYIAPRTATPMNDTVTAVSQADSSKIGTASVTISPTTQGINSYWVAPSGSDANDGSQGHPWATILHADAALSLGSNGTVVHVAPGTYQHDFFTISSNGTANARLTYVSDTPHGAKIVGGMGVLANYVDVIGFEVTCPSCWSGIGNGAANAPYTGGSHNRILNNYIHDIGTTANAPAGYGCPGGGAIYTANNSTDVLIDGNLINGSGSKHPCLEAHGVYVAGPGVTLTNNIISNAVGWGIQFYGDVCHEVASNNTIFHNYQGGIIASAGLDNPGQCNVSGTPYNDYSAINNNLIVNNGIDGNGAYGIEEFGPGRIGPHNIYSNNLTVGNRPDDSIHLIGGGTSSNNISIGNTGSIFANYQDNGTGDYHLLSGSPAIDAGTAGNCASSPGLSPCEPGHDFDGNGRPQGAGYDIGAFEYISH